MTGRLETMINALKPVIESYNGLGMICGAKTDSVNGFYTTNLKVQPFNN